ncbi:MAG: hypothetical protein VXZ35_11325 [Pseudomonadota bacterium]|nr:hypothetical protein [Pseudomonadota bacterium]
MTTAIKDGGATAYTALAKLTASASLQTQVTTVLNAAKAMQAAELALANGEADKKGAADALLGASVNPAPGGFLAARKAADDAYRLAVANGEQADYDAKMLGEQTSRNSYLFRAAARMKADMWNPKTCEADAAADRCRLLEGGSLNAAVDANSGGATGSILKWPSSNNCDVGSLGSETGKCRMRGLLTPEQADSTLPENQGLINIMDELVGGGTLFKAW